MMGLLTRECLVYWLLHLLSCGCYSLTDRSPLLGSPMPHLTNEMIDHRGKWFKVRPLLFTAKLDRTSHSSPMELDHRHFPRYPHFRDAPEEENAAIADEPDDRGRGQVRGQADPSPDTNGHRNARRDQPP